jgi:hypothetical protein
MTKLIKEIVRFAIFLAFVVGALLVARQYLGGSKDSQKNGPHTEEVSLDQKSATLKSYLLGIKKPQRIEFTNLSQRYEKQIQSFKQLKIPQDKNSDFYISIQFFTDEGDNTAPLVAQIRFIDIKSGNTTKEESINLE